jgi:hypothetical protein
VLVSSTAGFGPGGAPVGIGVAAVGVGMVTGLGLTAAAVGTAGLLVADGCGGVLVV